MTGGDSREVADEVGTKVEDEGREMRRGEQSHEGEKTKGMSIDKLGLFLSVYTGWKLLF